MSKYNKVNPGIYTQRGRLTPDEAARQRRKQGATSPARTAQPMIGAATSRTKTPSTRKAVLARNAGGPGASPRPTTKRRRG